MKISRLRFDNLTIRQKLVSAQMLTTFVVLFLFCFILGYLRVKMYQNSVIERLSSLSQVIGSNSASALTFLDNDAAVEILLSLKAETDIANAWIYNSSGALFARFSRENYEPFSYPCLTREYLSSGGGFVTISKKIMVNQEIKGFVAMRLSTRSFRQIIAQNILVAFLMLVLGMVLAFLLSLLTLQAISKPIVGLVGTVKRISESGDYSIRVKNIGTDEIGVLYSGFNAMLDQIQVREVERNAAYKSLQDSEHRFKTLVSNIPGAIYRCAFDEAWTATFISPEIEKITGYSPADFTANAKRTLGSAIHPKDRDAVREAIYEAVKLKKAYAFEYRMVDRENKIHWVYERGQGVFDERGRVLFLDGSIFDITERREAESLNKLQQQQLVQADKMASLGILVSGVAHEINNPNNFIQLNSENLMGIWQDSVRILDRYQEKEGTFPLAGLPYPEVRNETGAMIRGIFEGADRIKKIVQSLKDFARQDPGNMNQSLKLNSLVESSVLILNNLIKKSTDNFSVTYAENLPEIKGNGQQIEQVIINLISNACQAMEDKNRAVSVSTAYDREAKRVIVSIADEGRGISPGDLKYIMDPFFTTRRDSGGTGLGLSISYNIIKEHGGEIVIESEPGAGTTARIKLPVKAEPV